MVPGREQQCVLWLSRARQLIQNQPDSGVRSGAGPQPTHLEWTINKVQSGHRAGVEPRQGRDMRLLWEDSYRGHCRARAERTKQWGHVQAGGGGLGQAPGASSDSAPGSPRGLPNTERESCTLRALAPAAEGMGLGALLARWALCGSTVTPYTTCAEDNRKTV